MLSSLAVDNSFLWPGNIRKHFFNSQCLLYGSYRVDHIRDTQTRIICTLNIFLKLLKIGTVICGCRGLGLSTCGGPRRKLRFRCFFSPRQHQRLMLIFSHTSQTRPQRRAISILFTAMVREALVRASRSYLFLRSPCPFPKFIPQWHHRRPYSIQSQEEAIAQLPDINPSALSITRTTTPKQILPPEELIFGRNFTGKHATALPE